MVTKDQRGRDSHEPSRQERRRALRDAIYRSYESAAAEPELMADSLELLRDFEVTVGDGLETFGKK